MSGQYCKNYDVKQETVHSGNTEILGKKNSLFPSGPVIKCLLLKVNNMLLCYFRLQTVLNEK